MTPEKFKFFVPGIALLAMICAKDSARAQQAAAQPATAAPSDTLRVSARSFHDDVTLKAADLKALPRTTSFHSGEIIVADTLNGQPLDVKSGPLKLVVTEVKRPAR